MMQSIALIHIWFQSNCPQMTVRVDAIAYSNAFEKKTLSFFEVFIYLLKS